MINFNFPILKNKFKQNFKIKKELLKLIDEQKSGELKQDDSYYTDSISKVDWDKRHDTKRKWVNLVGPYLVGFNESVQIAPLSASVADMVNLAALACFKQLS